MIFDQKYEVFTCECCVHKAELLKKKTSPILNTEPEETSDISNGSKESIRQDHLQVAKVCGLCKIGVQNAHSHYENMPIEIY